MEKKTSVKCEVIHCEPHLEKKDRYDLVIKQIITSQYKDQKETKRNDFTHLKSKIKLSLGHQELVLQEGEYEGRAWVLVVETNKPVVK